MRLFWWIFKHSASYFSSWWDASVCVIHSRAHCHKVHIWQILVDFWCACKGTVLIHAEDYSTTIFGQWIHFQGQSSPAWKSFKLLNQSFLPLVEKLFSCRKLSKNVNKFVTFVTNNLFFWRVWEDFLIGICVVFVELKCSECTSSDDRSNCKRGDVLACWPSSITHQSLGYHDGFCHFSSFPCVVSFIIWPFLSCLMSKMPLSPVIVFKADP